MNGLDAESLPRIPIGDWFDAGVDWVSDHLEWLLDFIDWLLKDFLYDNVDAALNWLPGLVMALVLGALGVLLRGWLFGALAFAGLLLIQSMRLWQEAMDTLALTLIAAAFALLIAVPLGILAARNAKVSAAVRPVMDLMQTMPAFVYLIPTLFFFGIGETPGIVSTIVFATPPGVRLTELGIRQVHREMVEAGHAFGSTPLAILRKVQIPLAMPTIMAGVNQVIMLSLSMVVIAGLVGAGGLGGVIYGGITRLDISTGFEGGVAVVILAIYLDRITSALGDRSAVGRATKKTAGSR